MEQSISIYIHIPFCISKCEYCDFFSIPCKTEIKDGYIDAVCKEFDFRLTKYPYKNIKSLYIGGGTPSLLNGNQLKKLSTYILSKLNKEKDFEFTVEVNPDDVSITKLNDFEAAGVNRISVGIQSMTDKVLKNQKRRAGLKENEYALKCIKENWKGTFSVDLIAALPEENLVTQLDSIKKVIEYKPHHISFYSLTIEDETPLGKKYNNNEIEYDFDVADSLWLSGKELIEKNDYAQYEVSNFAKKGKECIHNMAYWSRKSYFGLGSGGCGTVYNSSKGFRWTNTTDIEKYINNWTLNFDESKIDDLQTKEILDSEMCKFEYFMMCLRTFRGIYKKEYETIFGEKIPQNVIQQFEDWKKIGLAQGKKSAEYGEGYSLTRDGILFLNKFLEDLKL